MADLEGDRSYLLVYAAEDGKVYELRLTGTGYPDEFEGYMTPSIRQQQSGDDRELPWPVAERLAIQLRPLSKSSKIERGGSRRALECVESLLSGRRYGHVSHET